MATFCTGCGHEVRPDLCTCRLDYSLAVAKRERDMARDKCAVLLADALRLESERDDLRAKVEAMQQWIDTTTQTLAAHEEEHGVFIPRGSLPPIFAAYRAVPGDQK